MGMVGIKVDTRRDGSIYLTLWKVTRREADFKVYFLMGLERRRCGSRSLLAYRGMKDYKYGGRVAGGGLKHVGHKRGERH